MPLIFIPINFGELVVRGQPIQRPLLPLYHACILTSIERPPLFKDHLFLHIATVKGVHISNTSIHAEV